MTEVGIFEEFWDTPKPVVGFHTELDELVEPLRLEHPAHRVRELASGPADGLALALRPVVDHVEPRRRRVGQVLVVPGSTEGR